MRQWLSEYIWFSLIRDCLGKRQRQRLSRKMLCLSQLHPFISIIADQRIILLWIIAEQEAPLQAQWVEIKFKDQPLQSLHHLRKPPHQALLWEEVEASQRMCWERKMNSINTWIKWLISMQMKLKKSMLNHRNRLKKIFLPLKRPCFMPETTQSLSKILT